MSNEQNATPGRRSLLDQIHAVKEFAERWGYPDLAEWLTKHADEPCPAATAQFMEMDVAPPSEPPRSEAVREAIALIKRHDKCGRGQTGICRLEGEGRQCMTADDLRPVIFALADAERKLADERVRAVEAEESAGKLEERAFDLSHQLEAFENWAGEIHELPSLFMLGGFRHKVTAVEGHYDGSYIVAQKIGEFDPPTKPLPPPSELAEAAERKLQVERARVADLTSRLAATEKWSVEGWTCNAVLTRKLATARKAITVGLRIIGYPADGMPPLEGDDELHALHKFKTTMQAAVATIDAPAGEEVPIPPGGKCPECGGVTYGTREVHLSDCSRWMRAVSPEPANARPTIAPPITPPYLYECSSCGVAPCNRSRASCETAAQGMGTRPVEPAIAQGGGDAEESLSIEPCIAIEDLPLEGQNNICGRPLASHCPFPNDGCALQHHGYRSTELPPSPPPFTAEEARERAEWIKPHMFMTGEPDSDVVEAARTAESLRHYADLLDRDDALERAAAGALKLLHDVFDFTKRTPQVEATIANLSAVLAQHAGKAE